MSPRRTNAKPPPNVLNNPHVQVIRNLQVGAQWANELGRAINQTDVGDWDKRKLVLAALTLAAAHANETQLDEDDWMEMAITAFRGITIDEV